MDTPELFDFSFVDREREQIIFDKFMLEPKKNVLWIDGKHGVGKTQFVKHAMKTHKNYSFAYCDVKPDKKNTEILVDFIKVLQGVGGFDFGNFVLNEYSSFHNSLGSTINILSKALTENISNIVSLILDFTNYVLTKSRERRESIDIIQKYIEKILLEKNLFICVDNFSRCSEDISAVFCNIFKRFLECSNCRICLITTTDDMDDEKRVKFRELINNLPIAIKKFDDHRFFYEIMEPIFEMGEFTEADIKYIYLKCHGKPQKLSVVISKLLDRQGIQYDSKRKAVINKKILKDILKEEHINKKHDFSESQKWILFSFLCLYDNVNVQDVKELAMYIAKNNLFFFAFNENVFHEQLLELVDHNHLHTDGQTLSTCHDSDYIDFTDIFVTSAFYQMISKSAYEFLLSSPTLCVREDLICRHMREANIPTWENRNYLYGKELFRKHQYYDAQKIFSYLLKDRDLLNEKQLLLIGINEYEVGHYESAIDIMKNISIDDLIDFNDKYNLVFYWGKSIYNHKFDLSEAIEKLKEAITYVVPRSKEYVKVQNLLQMYYMEVPGCEQEALGIFNEIRNEYKALYPEEWASTMRGCHNFLYDENDALELLAEAVSCTNDTLEHAYIDTTRGFVYARAGNLDEAMACFESSYESIKDMKRHESSYAANNLAICYMMKDNYVKAREILQDALFWNRTNYGKIVLHVHLMICESLLNNKIETERHISILDQYMNTNNPKDEVMIRKVYLNLAVASKQIGENIMFQKYLDKAREYIQNTSSEWRFSVIQQKTRTSPPQNIYYSYSKFDPWFIVYAHD